MPFEVFLNFLISLISENHSLNHPQVRLQVCLATFWYQPGLKLRVKITGMTYKIQFSAMLAPLGVPLEVFLKLSNQFDIRKS